MRKYNNDSFPKERRIILGCLALGGESVTKLADESDINRKFIYTQKEKTLKIMTEHFDAENSDVPKVSLDDITIEKIVLSCALDCKASIRDIKEHFANVYNFNLSEGKISDILNKAAKKSKLLNESIPLDTIKVGAHDEIFQAGKPVLVGVDPLTTYVYLMKSSNNRDGESWYNALNDKKEKQQLNLEKSVTDGGTGMRSGIPQVYPDIQHQDDIFHCEMKLTKALNIYERKAYAAISNEYNCENKFVKGSDKKITEATEKYEKALICSKEAISFYDIIRILINWIKEMFCVGGYSYIDKKKLLEYLIGELTSLAGNDKHLLTAINNLTSNMEGLLEFVKQAENEMEQIALEESTDIGIVHLLWKQKIYSEGSKKYRLIDNEIIESIGEKIYVIKDRFKEMLKKLVRASSIVECINSLIRPYLSLKRTIKGNFIDLLQFYLNNRKYMNSRIEGRKGKSPLELLTGKEYGSWLELLGY